MDVIAAIGQCSTAPDVADFDPIWRWEGKLQRAADNSTIFGKTTNLYVNDRCFVPRRVCKVHVKETGATLLLPRDGPANVDLRSRQFDVVIGAAQVMGVVARTNFASLLEQAGGLPIVNLGKGAAGPHAYTDASNWRHLAPLFANARAVIICVMAGRSSSNSATGAFSGQSFGSEQIRAFDEVNGLLRSEGAEPRRRGERLRRESLETARSDYTELVRRIRAGSTSPGGYARPRVLLTWFSSCPIGGCAELWQYPQYFLAGTGSSSNVLTFLAPSLDGAEMVDLSYGHLPPSPPIAIDQCASCGTGAPTSERRVCSSPEFRQDALQHGRTCSSKCSARLHFTAEDAVPSECTQVRDPYYPDDAAHEYAYRVLEGVLRAAPDVHSLRPTTRPTAQPAISPARGEAAVGGGALAQPLGLDSKLFFSHIHKVAGTTLIAYLTGFEGASDCAAEASSAGGEAVVKADHTAPSSWAALEGWWFSPEPSCTFATLEEPELGARGGVPSVPLPHEPALLSFFREPASRCRSHWNYAQELCHRRPLGVHEAYCRDVFLPRFGAVNETSTHRAFVEAHCSDRATRSLTPANGIDDPLSFLQQNVSFVGIQEAFLESVCLLLHQAGQFPPRLCTCSASGEPLGISRELRPPLSDAWKASRLAAAGVPSLQLSPAEILQRSPRDNMLYAAMLRTLRARVRRLEAEVNGKVWGCGASRADLPR